jgi:hypothetical protein
LFILSHRCKKLKLDFRKAIYSMKYIIQELLRRGVAGVVRSGRRGRRAGRRYLCVVGA